LELEDKQFNQWLSTLNMPLLFLIFLVAYVSGVFSLIWFDLCVLGLGDPKFETALDLYFPLWLAFYLPAVITALVFLWRGRQLGSQLWRLAGIYLFLILAVLEASFVLDVYWLVLLLELVILVLLFRFLLQRAERITHPKSVKVM
jgi:hypothetical protein